MTIQEVIQQRSGVEGQTFERKERHSCDPKSSVRAKPKKAGGGGKFTFGKLGDERAIQILDKGDPNYDSEEEETTAAPKMTRVKSTRLNRPFSSMGQHLCSGKAKSSSNQYVWVVQQGEETPRVVGIYSSYHQARSKVLTVVCAENNGMSAGWKERPANTWTCTCDYVRIVQMPVNPLE